MTGDEVLSAISAAIMGDDVLKIEYLISGFHRVLYVPPPQWPGCRFEQGVERRLSQGSVLCRLPDNVGVPEAAGRRMAILSSRSAISSIIPIAAR